MKKGSLMAFIDYRCPKCSGTGYPFSDSEPEKLVCKSCTHVFEKRKPASMGKARRPQLGAHLKQDFEEKPPESVTEAVRARGYF